MLAERNPYDPIEIRWPSMWYWFKAGGALAAGVSGLGIFIALAWWMTIGGVVALLAALAHH